MSVTIGKKISELRKEKSITQEELAEMLGISPQAVSKWENDLSCPDIMLLPEIAKIFGTTVDELFSTEAEHKAMILPAEQRKNPDDMMLYVRVNSAKGDKVRVNLPIPLVKMALSMGISMTDVSGNDVFQNIDFEKIVGLIDKGLIGKLVEVESAKGDLIEVIVE